MFAQPEDIELFVGLVPVRADAFENPDTVFDRGRGDVDRAVLEGDDVAV